MNLTAQILINSLVAGSLYALSSAGLALCYYNLKIFNFAHGQLLVLSGYIFYAFYVLAGLNFASAACTATALSCLFSLFVLKIFVRPFQDKGPLLVIVTTLALAVMIEALLAISFGVGTKWIAAESEAYLSETLILTGPQLFLILLTLITLLLTFCLLEKTGLRRSIRASAENQISAAVLRISPARTYKLSFVISAFLAALCGIFLAIEQGLQPGAGSVILLKSFAIIILAGSPALLPLALFSFAISLLEQIALSASFLSYSLPVSYADALIFLLALMVLLIKPERLLIRTKVAGV